MALATLARRATGSAGRFACHAVQRSAQRVLEFARSPKFGWGERAFKMLAQPTQKRVLPLRGSGRNHTGVVGLLVDFCNSEIVAFDDISRRFRYSLAAGGGERRLLALIN